MFPQTVWDKPNTKREPTATVVLELAMVGLLNSTITFVMGVPWILWLMGCCFGLVFGLLGSNI